MRSLVAWLKEPWDGNTPFEDDLPFPVTTRLQVYAAMVAIGGDSGGGYGIICGGGLYGRRGLHQQEAFTWWRLNSYIGGWLTGTDNAEAEEVKQLLNEEWYRVKSLTGVSSADEAGDGQPSNR